MGQIELLFMEVKERVTLTPGDLLDMAQMQVHTMTHEEYDEMLREWRERGEAPLFPREDVE